MKKSKKTLIICSILALVIVLLIGSGVKFYHSALIEKFRHEGIEGIAIALTVYAMDDEILPPLDKWCDKLIEEADCGPGDFAGWIDRQVGECGYAINENLDGLNFWGLDDKVVLAFESKGQWNLSGGVDLAKNTKRKEIAVVFADGHMDFVGIEELDELQWRNRRDNETESGALNHSQSDEYKRKIKYKRWSKVIGGQFWSFSTEEYEVVKKDFDIVRGMGGRWFTSRRLLREGYNITREEMVQRIVQSFEYYEWKQTKLRQGKYVLSAIYETSGNDLRFTRGPFSSNDSALEHIVTIHISDDASVVVIYGEVVW